MVKCLRCGDPGIPTDSDNALAKPFKKAKRGYCTPCAVCSLFQQDLGHALPLDFAPRGLLLPHIQKQLAHILALGKSELTMEQIDWNKVIEKWDIDTTKGRTSKH